MLSSQISLTADTPIPYTASSGKNEAPGRIQATGAVIEQREIAYWDGWAIATVCCRLSTG
jgi:hypothetical protein